MFMRSALFAGAALFALSSAVTVANAIPMGGTFGVQIYQGTSNGNINDPNAQADQFNGLLSTPGALLATGSYTGLINFHTESPTPATIGAFLASGPGVATLDNPGVLGNLISQNNFQLTTLFVFTGTEALIADGSIKHDDGASLYDSSGALIHAPIPTEDATQNYAGLTGAWTLYYVEANGLPATLVFDVSRERAPGDTPLPAAAWMFGTVLAAGGGFGTWRKRRRAA